MAGRPQKPPVAADETLVQRHVQTQHGVGMRLEPAGELLGGEVVTPLAAQFGVGVPQLADQGVHVEAGSVYHQAKPSLQVVTDV